MTPFWCTSKDNWNGIVIIWVVVVIRGVNPRVWGSGTPWKYVGGVRVCFGPWMLQSFIQNCCCITHKFHSIMCSRHYHFTDFAYADVAAVLNYIWSAPSRQCPPINAFCCTTGLKVIVAKTKLQNVGAGDPPSKILIDGVPVEGV